MQPKERLSEGTWVPPWLEYQHVARYEWVRTFCAGRRVLDAACANGYGTRIIASVAGFAAGCDLSLDPLAAPEARGSRLLAGDTTRMPFPDESFDVFVSFETIEHVRDDAAYLSEALRVLAPGGTLVLSTPNRLVVNPGNAIDDPPFNPFHVREYGPEELARLLMSKFTDVELLGQRLYGVTYQRFLASIGRRSRLLAVRMHQARKVAGIPFERRERHEPRQFGSRDMPEVLIAICRKS